MKYQKWLLLNRIAGVNFLISSCCLLVIPFLNIHNGMTVSAYIVAALFWIGLLIGFSMEFFLSVKFKKILKKKWKTQKIFYIVSATAFLCMVILTVVQVNDIFWTALSLFFGISALEAATVIKKEKCLK